MKARANLYALGLLVLSLALSLGLDQLTISLRRRATETFIMAPRIWGQIAASAVFVLAMIFLLWFILIRSQPGWWVCGLYLIIGLFLVLYYPLRMTAVDLAFGLLPNSVLAFLWSNFLSSYLSLNAFFLTAIGAIGLARAGKLN